MKIVFFVLFLLSINLHAANTAELDVLSPEERWKRLMALVNDEIKTIKGNKYSGAELKHRLFELYSEKIKLIRQKENEMFLKASQKAGKPIEKEKFFKSSTEQFKVTEEYGVTVIKKYPDYKKNNQIFYAMAINSRDFDDSKRTDSFLRKAIEANPKDIETVYNSKVGLAEFYYNNKKYSEAIGYYQDVLKNTTNEWYAKHLYNSAWCFLKMRDFKTALNQILGSFEASKNSKIVSMNDQILNAAGLFYVQADQATEGIHFYEKNTKNPSYYLMQMAKYSQSKNNFNLTDEILLAALKDAKSRKDIQSQVDVHQIQLDIYRENKKIEMFYATAESLKNIYLAKTLTPDDTFTTINKVKEFAGFLQVNLVKDKNKEVIDYNKTELKHIIAFFDILTSLDTKQTNLYHYYQAETFLSAHDFKGALRYYQKSVLYSKREKDSGDITKKAIESILSTLEHVKLKKHSEERITTFAIKNYLIFYPTGDRAKIFYQKLFSINYKKEQLNKALNVLVVYEHYFKEDIKIHREMLTQILEYRIQKKQTNKLAFWVNKIDSGYLKFDDDYIQKSIRILGQLLFEKYQALEKKGQISEALAGYESIFENKKYPKQTKAESAFAISLLKIQLNESKESYEWLSESMSMFDSKEIDKISSSLLSLSKGYRLLQKFDYSTKTAEIILEKYCSKDTPEKDEAFEITVENGIIANVKNFDVDSSISKYSACKISKDSERKMVLKTFNYFLFNNNKTSLVDIYKKHSDLPEISRLFNQYINFEITENDYDISELTKSIPDERLKKTEEKTLKIREYLGRLESLNMTLTINPEVAFDEEKFNGSLEEKFTTLNNFTQEAKKIVKDASLTDGFLIKANLGKKTIALAESLNALVAHPSMDKEYANGFLGQMKEFGADLNKRGNTLTSEAKAALDKESHFTKKAKILYTNKIDDELQRLMQEHYARLFLNTLDRKVNMTLGK